MIDHKQYTKDAIRTESVKPKLQLRQSTVFEAMRMAIIATEILDAVKKYAFYGKQMNYDKTRALVESLNDSLWTFDMPSGENDVDIEINGNTRALHAVIGIATEAGELLKAMLHRLETGEPLDHVNLHEEVGDLNWYQAILLDSTGGDLEQVLDRNIAKLKARYGDKFSSERAVSRDLDNERRVLEGSKPPVPGDVQMEAEGNLAYHAAKKAA